MRDRELTLIGWRALLALVALFFATTALLRAQDRILFEVSSAGGLARRLSHRGLGSAALFVREAAMQLAHPRGGSTYITVMHHSVGALEEVACHQAGMSGRTLHDAANALFGRGWITARQRDRIEQLYRQRNRTRGIAHGSGSAEANAARRLFDECADLIKQLLPRTGGSAH